MYFVSEKTPCVDSACAECPGALVWGSADAWLASFVQEPQSVPLDFAAFRMAQEPNWNWKPESSGLFFRNRIGTRTVRTIVQKPKSEPECWGRSCSSQDVHALTKGSQVSLVRIHFSHPESDGISSGTNQDPDKREMLASLWDWKFQVRLKLSSKPPTEALSFVGNSEGRDRISQARLCNFLGNGEVRV